MPRSEARAAIGLEDDAPVFLFFGFIRRYKGLHVLARRLEERPAPVAHRPPRHRGRVLRRRSRDPSGQVADLERVHLEADYIPDDRVPLFFSAADAVVQPYVSATQSGVAQIAFHFGRPVITSDVGGLAEIVGSDAGLVVPPNDAVALEDAMVQFVEDDLGPRLSEGVARQRDRFSWGRLVEAVEELSGV